MLNLHEPFRWATSTDRDGIAQLGVETAPEEAVVAEEDGRIAAFLSGRISGETWHVEALAVTPARVHELGRRLLSIADALAADEGLASVGIRPDTLSAELRALLDQEGFRAAADESGLMLRPVVPQG